MGRTNAERSGALQETTAKGHRQTNAKRARGSLISAIADYAGDLVIPRNCLICGRHLYRNENHLCIFCEADIPLTYHWLRSRNPMADRLNALIQEDAAPGLLQEEPSAGICQHRFGRYAYAAALFFYHGTAEYRKITQRLKYSGDITEGRRYAALLGRYLRDAQHLSDIDLILPVPLHWTRRWKRGYNQSEVIAGEISKALGVPMRTDILKRTKRTKTQTKLDVQHKALNVNGAFSIASGRRNALLQSRHILLVDDVFTTGATMYACFAALSAEINPGTRLSAAALAFVDNG